MLTEIPLDDVATLRQRLDAFNRWLHRFESDLSDTNPAKASDDTLADAIGDHLNEIGLDSK